MTTQETIMAEGTTPTEHVNVKREALATCVSCGHLVPKTMMCLYCGAPILFKKPGKAEARRRRGLRPRRG